MGKAIVIAVALGFGWSVVEIGALLTWPDSRIVMVFVDIVVYAAMPIFAARPVKTTFPRGITVGPIVATSVLIVSSIILGHGLFFAVMDSVYDPLVALSAPSASLGVFLYLIAFVFALRSFQEGEEFSARSAFYRKYGGRYVR